MVHVSVASLWRWVADLVVGPLDSEIAVPGWARTDPLSRLGQAVEAS